MFPLSVRKGPSSVATSGACWLATGMPVTAGCVATTAVRPSSHSYSNLPAAGEVMGKTAPEAWNFCFPWISLQTVGFLPASPPLPSEQSLPEWVEECGQARSIKVNWPPELESKVTGENQPLKNVAELCPPSYAGGGFVSFGMLSPTRATDRMALGNRQELLQRDGLEGGGCQIRLQDITS